MASFSFKHIWRLICLVQVLLVPNIWTLRYEPKICQMPLFTVRKQKCWVTFLSVAPQKGAALPVLIIIQRGLLLVANMWLHWGLAWLHLYLVHFQHWVSDQLSFFLKDEKGEMTGSKLIHNYPHLLKIYIIYTQFNYQIKTNLNSN